MEARKASPNLCAGNFRVLKKLIKIRKATAIPRKKQFELKPQAILRMLEKKDFEAFNQALKTHKLTAENIAQLLSFNLEEKTLCQILSKVPELPESTQLLLLKMPNRNLLKTYAWHFALCDAVISELITRGEDTFLEQYINRRKLSDEMQCLLIRAHKLRLIEIYISKHTFGKKAQTEFLSFMQERLLR